MRRSVADYPGDLYGGLMGCYSGSGGGYNQSTFSDGWLYKATFSGFLSRDVVDPPNLPPGDDVSILWTQCAGINDKSPSALLIRNGVVLTTGTNNLTRKPWYQITVFYGIPYTIKNEYLPLTVAGEYGWDVEFNIELTAEHKWRAYGEISSSQGSVSFDETFSTEIPSGVPFNEKYYQIVGFDDQRTAAHPSGGEWFYCSDGPGGAPEPPTLIRPADQSIDVDRKPFFEWLGAVGSDTYRIQVSTDGSFGSTVIDQADNPFQAWQTLSNLATDTKFYWRVNATSNGAGTSAWSDVWEFTTRVALPPDKPILRAPENNAVDVRLSTLFRWNAAARATSYVLEVSTDAGFTSPRITAGITSTYQSSENMLRLNTQFWWRVRAVNNEGLSAYSDEWTFTTIETLPEKDCPYVDNIWSFNCNIIQSLGDGYYIIAAGHQRRIKAFLCSNDSITAPGRAVALRTAEGEWFITVCERINYGKLYPQQKCEDPYCKALIYLLCGEKLKGPSGGGLVRVSTAKVVLSTIELVVINSALGQIKIKNDFGSELESNKKCVILNLDKETNNAKVLGPAE